VTRFRRGLVIALSAGVASALVGLAWAALEPVSLTRSGTVIPAPSAQPSHDAIAGAPATYAAVPQLGPPLPGDLGRAIVARERGSGQGGEIQADGNGNTVARDQNRAPPNDAPNAPVGVTG
jgi:type IV secretion system protein VirB10